MNSQCDVLPMEWFAGDVVTIARDLIGRSLLVRSDSVVRRAVIMETEAYGGHEDPASHAAFRPGGRARLMSGPPGYVYVYAAYGMYPCFNIVTGLDGTAAAVLLRGGLIDGQAKPIYGPGRLTRALGITLADHGSTLHGERFAVSSTRITCCIEQTERIGIRRGQHLRWRFVSKQCGDMT